MFTLKCLEVLRRKLPIHFKEFPNGTKFGIIRYGDFLGNKYPAIGIQCELDTDYEKIPDFIDLYAVTANKRAFLPSSKSTLGFDLFKHTSAKAVISFM